MALIKPEQLRSGSYSITGSFSGSFYGNGSNLTGIPSASYAISASYAVSASYEINYETSSSYAETASLAYTASYYAETDPVFTAVSGTFVLTSSFNSFTSSYYVDSGSFSTRVTNLENFSSSIDATFATDAELNAATSSLSASISNLSSSFEVFSGSYNTGSFTGSFIGDLTGTASNATSASYALTASYLEGYISPFPYTGSAEITGSLSVTGSTSLYHSGSTILSINGSQGEIFSVSDDTSGDLLVVQSGSTELFVVSASGDTTISGSLVVTNGITSSLYGTSSWAENALTSSYILQAESASYALTASYVENAQTASYVSASNIDGTVLSASYALTASHSNTSDSASYALTSSYVENAQTASYVLQAVSASYASVANSVNDLNQNVFISGSLTVLQGATIYGSSSFVYVTASQLDVSASFISVNVFEPVQRFGGLKVYDSGSSSTSASLAWDSLHNHWVYQNVSGSTYTGGMLLSGPRNTGSLGDEPNLTLWYVPRSDGGDHLDNSQIYSSGSITIVTGSLTVTNGITGSLSGSATNAVSASYAVSASFAINAQTASYIDGGFY